MANPTKNVTIYLKHTKSPAATLSSAILNPLAETTKPKYSTESEWKTHLLVFAYRLNFLKRDRTSRTCLT